MRILRDIMAAMLMIALVGVIVDDSIGRPTEISTHKLILLLCLLGWPALSAASGILGKVRTWPTWRKVTIIVLGSGALVFTGHYLFPFLPLAQTFGLKCGASLAATIYLLTIMPSLHLPSFRLRIRLSPKYLLTPLFFVVILLPGALVATKYREVYKKDHSFQTWAFDFPRWIYEKYPKKEQNSFDEWTNKITLKRDIVTWYTTLQYRMGRYPHRSKLVIGRDGHGFIGNNYSRVTDQAKRNYPFTSKQIGQLYVDLVKMRDWLHRRGIAFYFVVAPNHHTIYQDKLPWRVRFPGPSFYEAFRDHCHEQHITWLIDLQKPLKQARQNFPNLLYYKLNSHWNNLGAFLAYREIMKHLNRYASVDALQLKEYTIKSSDSTFWMIRHHRQSMHLTFNNYTSNKKMACYNRENGRTYHVPSNQSVSRLYNWVITNKNALNELRLVLFRDSFTTALSPLFNRTFKTVSYTNLPELQHKQYGFVEICQELRPHILIIESVERSLPWFRLQTPNMEVSHKEAKLAWKKIDAPFFTGVEKLDIAATNHIKDWSVEGKLTGSQVKVRV